MLLSLVPSGTGLCPSQKTGHQSVVPSHAPLQPHHRAMRLHPTAPCWAARPDLRARFIHGAVPVGCARRRGLVRKAAAVPHGGARQARCGRCCGAGWGTEDGNGAAFSAQGRAGFAPPFRLLLQNPNSPRLPAFHSYLLARCKKRGC